MRGLQRTERTASPGFLPRVSIPDADFAFPKAANPRDCDASRICPKSLADKNISKVAPDRQCVCMQLAVWLIFTGMTCADLDKRCRQFIRGRRRFSRITSRPHLSKSANPPVPRLTFSPEAQPCTSSSRRLAVIWALAGSMKHSAAWLGERLQPIALADAKRTAKLIAELDSNRFAVRDRAARGKRVLRLE